jgi:hypothetical protein
MSARGFLMTGPLSRPKIISESKRYIPPFWLSFLSTKDIESAERRAFYLLDRKAAIEGNAKSLAYLAALFPQVASFERIASSLLAKIKARRSAAIAIDVSEFVADDSDPYHESLPTLETAIKTIENRDADYSLIVPARTIPNPFTGEDSRLEQRRFRSAQEMLLFVCSLSPDDLIARSEEAVRESIIGHVWD